VIRYTLLWAFIAWLSIVSLKDWYKGVCGLVFLMALVERPDMPKQMFDIPGLNPWNLLFVIVVTAAIVQLGGRTTRAHLTPLIKNFLIYYLIFIFIAFFREIGDLDGIVQFAHLMGAQPISLREIIQEDTLNTLKYAVPGLLLFYGCNSKERFKWAVWTLLAMNFLLALQIIKVMPISALTDGTTLEQTAIRKIDRDIGYYRSDLAIFLGGAAWAIFCAKDLVATFWPRLAIYGASFLTMFAVALTGGRIGMGACIVVGTVMAWYKFRKMLFLGPFIALIIILTVPSIQERVTQGFTKNPNDGYQQRFETEGANFHSVTSGRTIVWPVIIQQIMERPFFGHGRRGMQRSGLSTRLVQEYNELFPHPHNAYLELFLDNGVIFGLPILIFYFIMLRYAFQMFKVKNNAICQMAGGMAVAFIGSFLIGAIGQQSFYPMIGSVGLWCSMGILLRIRMEYFPSVSQTIYPRQNKISWVQLENKTLLTK